MISRISLSNDRHNCEEHNADGCELNTIPPNEQHRIAAFLDTETAKIDA